MKPKLMHACLAFIASTFRVTEENLLLETDLSGPPSSFLMFSLLLKELIYIFLKKKKTCHGPLKYTNKK